MTTQRTDAARTNVDEQWLPSGTGLPDPRLDTDPSSRFAAEAPEHRACRDVAASERVPVVLLGGSFDGRRLPGNGPFPPSPHRCAKPAGGEWRHYIHQGQGVYRHVGLCDDHHDGDHPDSLP